MFSKFSFALIGFMLIAPLGVNAQEREVYVDSHGQRMLTGQHGSAVATLNQGASVEVLEDDGDWVKINVQGWVRRNALTSRKRSAQPTTTKGKLVLDDFVISKEPSKEGKMQAWLKLVVKNNTSKKISSWNAILIVRKRGGQVLFTTKVSHDDANIEPGETGSVRYYWDSHENQYNVLLSNPKNSLQLLLHKLQAN